MTSNINGTKHFFFFHEVVQDACIEAVSLNKDHSLLKCIFKPHLYWKKFPPVFSSIMYDAISLPPQFLSPQSLQIFFLPSRFFTLGVFLLRSFLPIYAHTSVFLRLFYYHISSTMFEHIWAAFHSKDDKGNTNNICTRSNLFNSPKHDTSSPQTPAAPLRIKLGADKPVQTKSCQMRWLAVWWNLGTGSPPTRI